MTPNKHRRSLIYLRDLSKAHIETAAKLFARPCGLLRSIISRVHVFQGFARGSGFGHGPLSAVGVTISVPVYYGARLARHGSGRRFTGSPRRSRRAGANYAAVCADRAALPPPVFTRHWGPIAPRPHCSGYTAKFGRHSIMTSCASVPSLFCVLVRLGAAAEADWPYWRGPDRDGMARGDAPLRWSDTEHIAWKADGSRPGIFVAGGVGRPHLPDDGGSSPWNYWRAASSTNSW